MKMKRSCRMTNEDIEDLDIALKEYKKGKTVSRKEIWYLGSKRSTAPKNSGSKTRNFRLKTLDPRPKTQNPKPPH